MRKSESASVAASQAARISIVRAPWHYSAQAAPRRGLVAAVSLSLVAAATLVLGPPRTDPGRTSADRGGVSQRISSLPLPLQGPVSASLGANSVAYRVSAVAGGLRARNPAQRMSASFDASGAGVGSGVTHLTLRLDAAGYGSDLRALPRVSPTASANRVTYAYPGLRAWYVNGPAGLEQGVTIPRPLERRSTGPLTLSMSFGGARFSLGRDGRSLTIGPKSDSGLRYSGLLASDARGRSLRSWLEVDSGRVQVRVDSRGAAYPLRIDPFVQQNEKLTAAEEIGAARFGLNVAISGDGQTALVAGGGDHGEIGAAWVYARSGFAWAQQGPKLTGTGEVGTGHFGCCEVALSNDGNTALIGGYADNGEIGAAWVFTRSGSTWTQQGPKLTAGAGEEIGAGRFGWSVALSGDGNTALIGAGADNGEIGAAWVFTRSGTTWTQQGPELTGTEEIGKGHFGCCGLALSGDGNTALIGGYANNGEIGAAWVFTRSGTTWTQQGPKLTGGQETGAGKFGWSAALSGDGNTALIGGSADNGKVGAAWFFTRSGTTWTQQGPKHGGPEGSFGYSVALSGDGNTALIGNPRTSREVGVAWLFTRAGSTWTQSGSPLVGGEESGAANFGDSVALSADGSRALIGGPFDADSLGAVWTFENVSAPRPAVTKVEPKQGPVGGDTTVKISGSGFTGAYAVRFGSVHATSFTVNSDTLITAVSPENVAGKADVIVLAPGGISPAINADRFKYTPTVTGVSPSGGPTTGGTTVTVTGIGFAAGKGTVIKFSATRGNSVSCTSSTQCTVVSPARPAGTVDVRVTVNKAISQKTPADRFTYS